MSHKGGDQPAVLQEVMVDTMTNEECSSPPNIYTRDQITDQMLCAGAQGRDSCQGDSGGPMVTLTDGGHYTIIGVVSWGRGCAMEAAPGVYARVTKVMDWIQDNIRGTLCDP